MFSRPTLRRALVALIPGILLLPCLVDAAFQQRFRNIWFGQSRLCSDRGWRGAP